ncbi:MAG: alpha-rhamnosidase, partial [Cyclobacteriaceae bacterium]|nr:alpha-rhamnosidase [Cyclobacteriaceae bacterium]
MDKTLLYFALIISSFLSCDVDKEKIEVADLECEYLKDPMGIDVKTPRLSWKLKATGNNIQQQAYRILAASDRDKLEENIGDFWDSDTINSDQSTQINYEGKVLNSRDKIYWKVGVWSQDDEAPSWSETASWEVGLLEETDWSAEWIGSEELSKPKVGQKNPARYFRKIF